MTAVVVVFATHRSVSQGRSVTASTLAIEEGTKNHRRDRRRSFLEPVDDLYVKVESTHVVPVPADRNHVRKMDLDEALRSTGTTGAAIFLYVGRQDFDDVAVWMRIGRA
jgi:hypothetical protein